MKELYLREVLSRREEEQQQQQQKEQTMSKFTVLGAVNWIMRQRNRHLSTVFCVRREARRTEFSGRSYSSA